MIIGIAAVVVGVIALAVIVRLSRSSSFKQSYSQTRTASRQVPRRDQVRFAASDLLRRVESMRDGRDLPAFYARLTELVAAGTFGSYITTEQVERAKNDPKLLEDIIRTLKRIA